MLWRACGMGMTSVASSLCHHCDRCHHCLSSMSLLSSSALSPSSSLGAATAPVAILQHVMQASMSTAQEHDRNCITLRRLGRADGQPGRYPLQAQCRWRCCHWSASQCCIVLVTSPAQVERNARQRKRTACGEAGVELCNGCFDVSHATHLHEVLEADGRAHHALKRCSTGAGQSFQGAGPFWPAWCPQTS